MKSPLNEFMEIHHQPCLAHTLNLIVMDGLKIKSDIITKLRSVVTFIHASSQQEEIFASHQAMVREDIIDKYNDDISTRKLVILIVCFY